MPGAQDLDIKPADNTAQVQVCRVYVAQGKKRERYALPAIRPAGPARRISLWSWTTRMGSVSAARPTMPARRQITSIIAVTAMTGWYTFKLRSYNTPASNPKPAYLLDTTYTAPQTL